MAQITQGRRIAVNTLGLLCFIVSGIYFHNVLESIVVGLCILVGVQLDFVKAFRKSVERED